MSYDREKIVLVSMDEAALWVEMLGEDSEEHLLDISKRSECVNWDFTFYARHKSTADRNRMFAFMYTLARQQFKFYQRFMNSLFEHRPKHEDVTVFEAMLESNLLLLHLSVVCRVEFCGVNGGDYLQPVEWLKHASYDENRAALQNIHVKCLEWLSHLPALQLSDYFELVASLEYNWCADIDSEFQHVYNFAPTLHPSVLQFFCMAHKVKAFIAQAEKDLQPTLSWWTVERFNHFVAEECFYMSKASVDKRFQCIRCMREYAGDLAGLFMEVIFEESTDHKHALSKTMHAEPYITQDGISKRMSWKAYFNVVFTDDMCETEKPPNFNTLKTMEWLLKFYGRGAAVKDKLLGWLRDLSHTHNLLNRIDGDKYVIAELLDKYYEERQKWELQRHSKRQRTQHHQASATS